MGDILAEWDAALLGSRLKRLGDRMQASALQVIADAGLDLLPGQVPLLLALADGDRTIGQLAESVGTSQPGVTRTIQQLARSGFVRSSAGRDQRRRVVTLSADGRAAVTRLKMKVMPSVGRAVAGICETLSGPLLAQIAAVEAALAERSLADRAADAGPVRLSIVDYRDELASAFRDINAEWINAMFAMEEADREVLENPRRHIIDKGGVILFVEAEGDGIIGTAALRPAGGSAIELTKMAVSEAARGLHAGAFLLAAIIERARALSADPLYLLTNRRCEAAIHLYERAGFRHDAAIMAEYGGRYSRADVAMRYVGAQDRASDRAAYAIASEATSARASSG